MGDRLVNFISIGEVKITRSGEFFNSDYQITSERAPGDGTIYVLHQEQDLRDLLNIVVGQEQTDRLLSRLEIPGQLVILSTSSE